MFLGYAAWAALGVELSRQPGNLAVLWFANAWAVGVLLCRPKVDAPKLLFFQACANAIVNLLHGDAFNLTVAFSVTNAIEVGISAWLLHRYFDLEKTLLRPAEFLKSLLLGALLPAAIGASLGSFVLSLAGLAPMPVVWPSWFMGSVYGYMAFSSLVLLFLYSRANGHSYLPAVSHTAIGIAALVIAYALLKNFENPYSTVLGVMVLVLVWLPALEAGLVNLLLAVLLAQNLSAQWSEFASHGTTANLVQSVVPAIAVLFVFAVLLVYIKAHKISAEKAELDERFIRSVTDAIPGMVGYWDANLINRFANISYVTWFGLTPQRMLGRHMIESLGEVFYTKNRPYIDGVLRGEPQSFKATLPHPDGSTHDFQAEYFPDIVNGEVKGYVVLVTDVTDLEQTKAQAVAANAAKSAFLANMSHEIRTPMNAVLGMLQLMHGTPLNARQQDYLGKAEASAQSLLGIINDILDFSKIEAGKLELDPNPFNLAALVNELRTIFEANLRGKRLELRYEIDPDIPPVLVGDALRLHQILINLGGNAIKFTPAGSVTLQVQRMSQSTGVDGQQFVRLKWSVIDTGIGISAQAQERLFSAFSQAESSTTRRFGGTGLGLAISQRLTELMGGELKLQSAPGAGSTFSFETDLPVSELQLEAQTNAEKLVHTQKRLAGLRVLVAEDNPINQQVAGELLTREGATVVLADHGQAALDRLQAGASDFDIVLMDMQMPVMDGLQATQAIRQRLKLTELPIIAMTANVMEQDRQACADAGMNDHVGKPFAIDELVKVLLRWVPEFESNKDANTEETPAAPVSALNLNQIDTEWPDADRIDVQGALSRLGGDPVLFAKLLEGFAHSLPKSAYDLKAHHDQPVNKAVADLLHTLKGTAATVGATRLSSLADQANVAAKLALANEGDAPPQGWLTPLQTECSSTAEAARRVVDAMGQKGLLPQETHVSDLDQSQIDPGLLLAQLEKLIDRLEKSDMACIDIHDQMIVNPQIKQDPLWAGLNHAMGAMDFDAALVEAKTLLGSLKLQVRA